VITSLDNARVKDVLRLRKGSERRRTGLFVVEGPREVERARAAGLNAVATYFAPSLLAWPEGEEVSERVLARMAYRAEPEGVLAIVETPRHELPRAGTLYLAAVGIEKPGNLGAMARTAAAAGADALLVADSRCDPWNPNAIRASTGAVFTLPILDTTLEDVLVLSADLVAATPAASTAYTDSDLAGPIVVAVGAEDAGLPEAWLTAADRRISIPLHRAATGATDSLNAAAAAAVILFEARRQRAQASEPADSPHRPRHGQRPDA
jgi:TrmH family RNA methyltransferase